MGHFYFVRHGQTIWNVENKICGATDIALTEFGHQQAIETGRKILAEGIKADEILYSPLIRAADTARHISEITGIPARVEPRLTEQRFGKWEATARNGEAFKKAKECFACSHEEGESTLHLAQRIYNLLDEIKQESDEKNLYSCGTQWNCESGAVLFLRYDKRRIRCFRSEKLCGSTV